MTNGYLTPLVGATAAEPHFSMAHDKQKSRDKEPMNNVRVRIRCANGFTVPESWTVMPDEVAFSVTSSPMGKVVAHSATAVGRRTRPENAGWQNDVTDSDS